MAQLCSARLLAIPWIALACAACVGTPGEPAGGGKSEFVLQAECSELRPRDVILRLGLDAKAKSRDARVEVSPYKDGFTTGRFVSASLSDPQIASGSGVALRAPNDEDTSALPGLATLRLEAPPRAKDSDSAKAETVLSGLVPGLNYYVRVRGISNAPTRVQAPICPVDFVDQKEESPK